MPRSGAYTKRIITNLEKVTKELSLSKSMNLWLQVATESEINRTNRKAGDTRDYYTLANSAKV